MLKSNNKYAKQKQNLNKLLFILKQATFILKNQHF